MVHTAAEPRSVTTAESAILTDTLVTQGSSNLRFTCTCGYIIHYSLSCIVEARSVSTVDTAVQANYLTVVPG